MPVEPAIKEAHRRHINTHRAHHLPLREYATVVGLARTGKFSASEIAQKTGLGPRRVAEIAKNNNVIIPDKWRAARNMVMPQYAYFRVIWEMTIEEAAARTGISARVARRREREVIAKEVTREMIGRNAAKKTAVPERGIIRELLGRRNIDESYRYSMRMIATATGRDLTAVRSANNEEPQIRSKEDMLADRERFRKVRLLDYKRLAQELKLEVRRLREHEILRKLLSKNGFRNPFSLNGKEKLALETNILAAIDRYSDHTKQWKNAETAKQVLSEIFKADGLYVRREEMEKKFWQNGNLDEALRFILQDNETKILKISNGFIGLHPEAATYYLPARNANQL